MVAMAKQWLRRIAFVLLTGAGLAGCSSIGDVFQPDVYTVRSGDTLYSIAWRYQRDVDDLVRWNNLDSPDTIFPGQRLRLSPGRGETVARAEAPREDSRPAPATRTSRSEPEPARPSTAPDAAPGRWEWPTEGEIVGTFNDGRVAGRGIDIRGEYGQPVTASAEGDVVYSGEGLPAYGALIIIRHSSEWLSAYAHNRRLLVEEGDRVESGDRIAEMGRAPGDDEVLLHFEIRQNGKPVDPLQYLPSR